MKGRRTRPWQKPPTWLQTRNTKSRHFYQKLCRLLPKFTPTQPSTTFPKKTDSRFGRTKVAATTASHHRVRVHRVAYFVFMEPSPPAEGEVLANTVLLDAQSHTAKIRREKLDNREGQELTINAQKPQFCAQHVSTQSSSHSLQNH
jgi:hypothetical protein